MHLGKTKVMCNNMSNWIRKQSGVTHINRSIRESTNGRTTWRGDVTIDGQSESQNGYPMDIEDLEADQERDGATT